MLHRTMEMREESWRNRRRYDFASRESVVTTVASAGRYILSSKVRLPSAIPKVTGPLLAAMRLRSLDACPAWEIAFRFRGERWKSSRWMAGGSRP